MNVAILLSHSFFVFTTCTAHSAALTSSIFAFMVGLSTLTTRLTILPDIKAHLGLVLEVLNILIQLWNVVLTWNCCRCLVILELIELIHQSFVLTKKILISYIGLLIASTNIWSRILWLVFINDFDVIFNVLLLLFDLFHLLIHFIFDLCSYPCFNFSLIRLSLTS